MRKGRSITPGGGRRPDPAKGGPPRADELLPRILTLGGLGVVVFGPDRKVAWAHGIFPGLGDEVAHGRSCNEIFAATDRRCEPCLLLASLDEGPLSRLVRGRKRPDLLYEVTICPIGSADQPAGWLAVAWEARHATGRGHLFRSGAAEAVRLVRGWSVPVILLDSEGQVQNWNRGAAELYGWSAREAEGRPWRDLVGEEDVSIPMLSPDTRVQRYETRHRTREGRDLDVMVTQTAVVGAEGESEGAVMLVADLTESRVLQGRLERKLDQLSVLREIAEVLQSATNLDRILRTILVGATAGQGLRFNRAFILLANRRAGKLRGRVAIGPANAEEAGRIWADLERRGGTLRTLLRQEQPVPGEADSPITTIVRSLSADLSDQDDFLVRVLEEKGTVRVADGVEVPGGRAVDPELLRKLGVRSFVVVPLIAEQKPVGLLLADHAITGESIEDDEVEVLELLGMQAGLAIERADLVRALERQVQALEEANRAIRTSQERLVRAERLSAVGEMAARVAHEIRNPLVAIGGFARLLLRDMEPGDPRRGDVQIIVSEVSRLETIVQEVLDYSRPAPAHIGRVNLARLAGEAVELLQWEMEEAGIHFSVEASADLPPAAVDREQVFRALVNVVKNAIHAMPEGGDLRIAVRALPGWLEMTVQDTGDGMSPEVRRRIFEPFYTTKSTGSGLGLTITAQTIRNHRGEIAVESEPGRGTRFIIRLPAAQEEPEHAQDPDHRG